MKFDNFSAVDEGFQPFDGGYSYISGQPLITATETMTQTIITNSVQGVSGWFVTLSSMQFSVPSPQYPNRKLVIVAQQYGLNANTFQNSPRLIPQQPNSFLINLGKTRMINGLTYFINQINALKNTMVNGVPSAQGLNSFLTYLYSANQTLRTVYVPYLNLNVTIPANIFRYGCYYINN